MIYPVCRVKIKGGVVTDKKLYYNGSITISGDILKAAGIRPADMVDVLNLNNGARVTTYVIEGPEKKGEICLNGPSARFFEKEDEIVILAVCYLTEKERKNFRMRIVSLSKKNRVIKQGGKNARNEKGD
ncbi:MAG: aspartate 1-decarboxylase [Candidatus Omnitrophica bacterium]|nr:aspartate 1-decarboxylase [Candidatus Omnitrophota bacterium]MCM8828408.1 aspartate 1-decarboxylase [Candidatus Omnitrophota bacterium]